jgi:hypothetical protein
MEVKSKFIGGRCGGVGILSNFSLQNTEELNVY